MAPTAYMIQDSEIDGFLPIKSAVGAATEAPQRFPTLSCLVLDAPSINMEAVLLCPQLLQT